MRAPRVGAIRTLIAVYSGGIQFSRPIHIGAIVEVDARIIHTGPPCMHIGVRVRSSPTTDTHVFELTTQCLTVFVAPAGGVAGPSPR
jgi:acyl-CoA hydrolase